MNDNKDDRVRMLASKADQLERSGQPDAAILTHLECIGIDPSIEACYRALCRLYTICRRYTEALDIATEAIERFEEDSFYYIVRGSAHLSLLQIDAAQTEFSNALEISSGNLDAVSGMANILFMKQEYTAASDLLSPYIENHGCPFPIKLIYAQLSSIHKSQDTAIRLLRETPDNTLSSIQLASKYFALGKLNDEIGEYDRAFLRYQTANTLVRQQYHHDSHREYFQDIAGTFTRPLIEERLRRTGERSRMVFIIGMPRSGTSLLEQILAAHDEVHGAGEITEMDRIVRTLHQEYDTDIPYPSVITALDEPKLEQTAQRYIRYIDDIDHDHRYVTDKLPDNFKYLGLINTLFPDAKVIHCRRDPVDTCLSCYFQQFSGHYPYAYDLADLAEYYALYSDLMDHWKEVLTIPIHEVVYEDLVEDLESQVRSLLAFCELEFDERCLEFSSSKRAVATSSAHQASQPLYKCSVKRWQNYSDYLAPLTEGLRKNGMIS